MSFGFLSGLLAALLVSVAFGCAGSLPETHYYTLFAPKNGSSSSVPSESQGRNVGVESFAVDSPYDQDRLVYRPTEGSTEVGFYNYHRWASPLGRLVAVALAEGLRGTTGIASIEPVLSTGDYSARLRGRVLQFEEIDLASAREARISLEIELVDRNGDSLWRETLTGNSRSVSGAEPIEHFSRAFDGVLGEARARLAAALE